MILLQNDECEAGRELARRAQDGDTAAFGQLVERHMKRAFVVAYRLMGNREDAEDLVQEAFIAAFRKLHTFDTGRSFAPWFFRILVRRGYNALDTRRVRGTELLDEQLSAGGSDPERKTERAELRATIRTAVDALPPRQRLIVELVELEGFTAAEVATMIGISAATARWHLHTARATLKRTLLQFAA